MSDSRCTCPACDAVLKLAGGFHAGKKIKCPKCNTVFSLPEPVEAQVREGGPTVRRNPDAFDDEPERRSRRRRRKRPAPSGMKPAVLALILVPVALVAIGALAGGGWLLVKLVNSEKDKDAVVAANTGNTNTPKPAPPVGNLPNRNPQKPPVQNNPPPQDNLPPPNDLPPNNPPPPPAPEPGPATSGIEVGNAALEIEGKDLDGKGFKLSDYRGKVVVLDFWGHW
jgi:phage FluMu protein Com